MKETWVRSLGWEDPLVHSPFLLGHDEPGDIVHHAVQESWKDYQLRMEI